jgi:ABC-type multidrug transport system fused ATPase/permease subunit
VLIRYLRTRRKDVTWLAVWSLVQSLPAIASGWSLAEATTQFLAGRTALGLAWLGLLAVAAAIGAFGTRMAFLRLGAIVEPFRDELVTTVVTGALARSTRNFASKPDMNSVARMTHQAEIVRDSTAGVLSVTCTFACTIVSTLIGLVTLLPATLPYVIPPLVASAILLRVLLRPYAARQRTAVLAEESVAAGAAEATQAARDITACGAEDLVLADLNRRVRRQNSAACKVATAGSARLLGLAVGGWLPLLLVLAAAPGMLRHGVSPGDVVGAITYITGSLRGALYTLSQGMGAGLVRLNVTLDRIAATSASDAAAADADVPGQKQPRPPRRALATLALRDVSFAYGPDAEPVIRDLTLAIPAGDHLAIVGPSGIGKSSLAGLIAGMLTPQRGEILFDGSPVTGHDRSWRVLIPQQAYVFAGTLAANLTYLANADRERLDQAAEAIGLTPLLTRLGGYGATVTPAALSAGERQLIALTRAYLSPSEVAILDEATCHLDPAAEERAETAFARRGGTLIVIAHRITSARRARRVLVLDGAHPEIGDHAALLARSPMYADLAGSWLPTTTYPERSVLSP